MLLFVNATWTTCIYSEYDIAYDGAGTEIDRLLYRTL